MPFVKIHRKKQFADYMRAYEIFVDGEKTGKISSGSSLDFFLPEGRHRIFLKIDWCASNAIEFELRGEETLEFDCGNNTKIFQELFYVLFKPKQYLWLKIR